MCKKRRRVDLFIIKLPELEKLDSNEEYFSSKYVFRQGLYIDYIYIYIYIYIFIGNNCITMSGGFRMTCLEKCILEKPLAAINDMKEDNLSKRNE